MKCCRSCFLVMVLTMGVHGCTTGQLPEIVDVRELSFAGGTPDIDRIIDLGLGAIPRSRKLEGTSSDGRAVIGELILVQGSGFTRQPRVSIGGRAAEVQARVEGGGILVKVPWGIDAGDVEVEVSHAGGRDSMTFPVRRQGLVLDDQGVTVVEIGADGAVTRTKTRVLLSDGARMALSWDGSVAYIGGGRDQVWLWVLDLTGAQPRIVDRQSLPGQRLIAVKAAEQAKLGVVVTDSHITYFDTYRAASPAFYTPHRIPRELAAKQVLTAALGGQGRSLALLLSDLNQVAVIDTTEPKVLAQPELVDVVPDSRLQVVGDLRFSADGSSLWVVSSDTARSIQGGYQPTLLALLQVTAAGDRPSGRAVKVHEVWKLGEKMTTVELALARGEPIPPGTAIRPEPSTSSVYLAELPSDLLRKEIPWQGRITRSSLDNKKGEEVAAGRWLATSMDVVGATQVVVALGILKRSGKVFRVLIHKKAWRGGAPKIVELSEVSPDEPAGSALPRIGMFRAQP